MAGKVMARNIVAGKSMTRTLADGLLIAVAVLALAGCAETGSGKKAAVQGQTRSAAGYKIGEPYQVKGVWYYPKEDFGYDETGIASWYGPGFHAETTANGETFDQNELTGAHKTLPLPSLVRVTNLENGRSIIVRINDRGPFVPGRIVDLSRRSAQLLGFEGQGSAKVRVAVLPEESRAVAAAARAGQAGVSVADISPDGAPKPVAAPRGAVQVEGATPVRRVAERQAFDPSQTVAGATVDGRFMPAAVVADTPVRSNGRLYVQAGAFTVYDNANRLRARLSDLGTTRIDPTMVGQTQYFRVRIGPLSSVEAADSILNQVIEAGNNGARVIVD
ncbi:MAG TPA: septal ring lytic transglycosylase RlpA family protein [Skermanella sp.]|jgi:rare lipoprotein A|nr:septal ring lytic transglycosylase RlpA family protein [Skermanella sp.]